MTCSKGRVPEWYLCIVADGHGGSGHRCSARVCKRLSFHLSRTLDSCRFGMKLGSESSHDAFKSVFAKVEEDLLIDAASRNYDVTKSGCAAVALAMSPRDNVSLLAWVGDCQAVLFGASSKDFHTNVPHKPHDPFERIRIEAHGGIVEMLKREGGQVSSYAWDKKMHTGLAMSRCFGDHSLKCHGILAEPSVLTLPLPENPTCVIGSDVMFDFMPPK